MPCICLACAQVRRAPVESFFIVIFDLIGLALEIVTGFRWQTPYPQIDKIFDKSSNSMSGHDHEENVHRRDLTNIPIVLVLPCGLNTQIDIIVQCVQVLY